MTKVENTNGTSDNNYRYVSWLLNHMKIITVMIITIFLSTSCKSDKNFKTEFHKEKQSTKMIQPESQNKEISMFLKFTTIKEMLNDSHDFSEENNTLKFISTNEKSLHVQVSKPILEADLENVKREIVKRDIVYVAFQAFAQTDINKITVTSVPVEYENYKKYVEKYKQTVTIDREKAKSILKKYLQTEDFIILYDLENDLWLPSRSFSILKFEKLNEVFNDMQ